MKKLLTLFTCYLMLCVFMLPSKAVHATSLEEIQEISKSGLNAYKLWMDVTAQNIANATVTRTQDGGPYRRKYLILVQTDEGVKVLKVARDFKKPLVRIYDPGHPDADRHGFVYMPNVDVSSELVKLSSINSLFDANLAALKTVESMEESIIDFYKQ